MTNEFDPLKELSDISEDEMNEFIAQQKVVTKKHRSCLLYTSDAADE